ncbi:hypothetical protein N7541_011085 [Penicillium brevicompactum]|uniref:FAD-binding domain-containing protein n=1 Tax=Penicillium brevicompactum TaxID=5074 RepID=A0A9W9UKI3_PENBR|nr:hypothetical protein N7541_011085 [Penicillium brevicompactum]
MHAKPDDSPQITTRGKRGNNTIPQDPVPFSGITVLVVGLGIAGLTAALECSRRGHKVIGFEKKKDTNQLGDVIGLSGNSMRILSQWNQGSLAELVDEDIICAVEALELHDTAGTIRAAMPYHPESPAQGYLFRRTGLLTKLYELAIRAGIDLRFGVNVMRYWEDADNAGVYIGEKRIVGDCVIAADGFYSAGRTAITNEDPVQQPIGAVMYRAIFDAQEIAHVPEAAWLLKKAPKADILPSFYGKDVMVMMGTAAKGRYVHWACTIRGEVQQASEAWMQPASVEPVLDCVRNWPAASKLNAVLSRTPPGACFNHTMLAMPPLRTWVSDKGRMVVIGDAAHPFLPYAGQGANQAIEDAASVAICLERAGRGMYLWLCGCLRSSGAYFYSFAKSFSSFRLTGSDTYSWLRHKRVSLIQEGSVEAKDSFLKANWDSDDEAGSPSAYLHQSWVYNHDCVQHVVEEFQIAADAIRHGRKYIPTNVPVDGKYRQE